ncbi:limonene-1,2-epoxide hydrolase [Nocardioides luteus]|uniref:Limonene-1,2-epoxide hydrolase n=1 Tax=Nocardioides luteus TaxID=1844 RepID=A0ABQ5SUN8_9ACTN|nr:limonene-1,2-epoxide hydrolase family protein [Nocardioides luteus]MDR7309339.1 limonene-1,2-epoxide hydrolase [Nocardioides luteus]GGR50624.1 limonene-1,2-epoxide hydrolase [Nocardioides luteus]GLJ67745.1 limonene-1,2-epoxide hydrolase [Nocardioides luteus]
MTETQIVEQFLAALEAGQIDAALELCAEDVTYQNVPLPPARGLGEVGHQLRLMQKYTTGFEARLVNIAANGPVVLTERIDVLSRGAVSAEFWVCGTFEVREGKIVLWRDYFDWTTFVAAGVKGAGRAVFDMVRKVAGR